MKKQKPIVKQKYEIWGREDGRPGLMCAPDQVEKHLSLLEEDGHFIHLATAVVDSWDEARGIYDGMWKQI